MNTKTRALLLTALLGLLLAVAALLAGQPAQAALPAQDPSSAETGIVYPTEVITVTTFIISNEAPGHVMDYLIATGHGNETLFQVLGYLKSQSNGIISDEFYNQVAAAPPGSEVFTAQLFNFAGLNGGIEIGADGSLNMPSVEGKNYVGVTGYGTAPSQNGQFIFTYAQDSAHYIYTHDMNYGGGFRKLYYAFGIAWRVGYTVFLPLVVRNP